MITVRKARPGDAVLIGAVHVAAWRSAYPGLLPDEYLAGLSPARMALSYERMIRGGEGAFVATLTGAEAAQPGAPRIVGFATAGRARGHLLPQPASPAAAPDEGEVTMGQTDRGRTDQGETEEGKLAEGEISLLYVLDDWRERGIGRRLMRAAGTYLAAAGCASAFLWVLRDNPSRWFYERLGGRASAEGTIRFAGRDLAQTAYVWNPIERLVAASPNS